MILIPEFWFKTSDIFSPAEKLPFKPCSGVNIDLMFIVSYFDNNSNICIPSLFKDVWLITNPMFLLWSKNF